MNSSVKYKCVGSVVLLPCEIIKPNPVCLRKNFNLSELEGLVDSIKKYGIIQPLIVRKNNDGYELISGERRLRAAVMAGLISVPCIVMSVSDEQCAAFAVTENLQRADLDFLEEADFYNYVIKKFGFTINQLSEITEKSVIYIKDKLRFINLSKKVRLIISSYSLTEKQIKPLLCISDEKTQIEILNYIIDNSLDVNETENYIDSLLSSAKPKFIKLKDIKILVNTLNHAVDTMHRAGVKAVAEQLETENYFEYVVRIPKTTISPVILNECVGSA
ncbi:MAG: ParB/RepB/Spo0J family partition protein [Clostridia bacterium]|nr:ParB/RepB/Spo0J family partition protein [Clostridia bacterium]